MGLVVENAQFPQGEGTGHWNGLVSDIKEMNKQTYDKVSLIFDYQI